MTLTNPTDLVVENIPYLQIPSVREQIDTLCRKNQVRRLALFGSVLREDFAAESDVDLLVEFLPGSQVGLIQLAQLESKLSVKLPHKYPMKRAVPIKIFPGAL